MPQFDLYVEKATGNYTLIPFAKKNAVAAAAGACLYIDCRDFESTALDIFEDEFNAFDSRSWLDGSELHNHWSSEKRKLFLESNIEFTVRQNRRIQRIFLNFPNGTTNHSWEMPLCQSTITEIHRLCQDSRRAAIG